MDWRLSCLDLFWSLLDCCWFTQVLFSRVEIFVALGLESAGPRQGVSFSCWLLFWSHGIESSFGAVQECPPPSFARDCLLHVKERLGPIHRPAGSCTPSLLPALPLVIWTFSLCLQEGSILMHSLVRFLCGSLQEHVSVSILSCRSKRLKVF
jgi:hypothetical protein